MKASASKSGLNIELIEKVAGRLNSMTHPVRLEIIEILIQKEKLSVTEIYKHLKIGQALTSNHLRILKENGILASRRDGKKIIYSVKEKALKNIVDCITNCNAA